MFQRNGVVYRTTSGRAIERDAMLFFNAEISFRDSRVFVSVVGTYSPADGELDTIEVASGHGRSVEEAAALISSALSGTHVLRQ